MRVIPTFAMACLLGFVQGTTAAGAQETQDAEVAEVSEAQGSTEEHPQNAAQEHFRLGQQAYDEARYEDAARNFQQAYDLSGRAELLYNMGLANERLLRWNATIDAFEMYLQRVPGADNRANIQARLLLARERLQEEGASGAPPESSSNAGPVALLVGGGALAIGGGVLVAIGASTIGDVESSAPGTRQWSEAEQDVSRGNTLRTSGVILLSVGVVALAAGLVWLLSRKGPDANTTWIGNGVRF